MSADGTDPAGQSERCTRSAEHIARLSAWIVDGASKARISPERAAGLLLDALTDDTFQHWINTRAWTE
ncbi:hypothetical protein AB0F03_37030 [Streptomyces sp. NPDC028722]|uniref:hypothetical protein n=1 Tax=Streptomyces sp. NPDC028722 TaxID=3155016 RepID=UPI00340ABBBC